MSDYRRAFSPGGTFFFTVVTYRRRRFLCEPENIALLRRVFREVMADGRSSFQNRGGGDCFYRIIGPVWGQNITTNG